MQEHPPLNLAPTLLARLEFADFFLLPRRKHCFRENCVQFASAEVEKQNGKNNQKRCHKMSSKINVGASVLLQKESILKEDMFISSTLIYKLNLC